MTSEKVQDLNDWMAFRGIPNVHEVIAQNFRKPHALENNLKFITQGRTWYVQSNVMISLSLMISYIKHCQYSAKSKYFGPFYNIQIDPQDYDEWRSSPPEEEIHFQTPSKFGSATTPRSTVYSEASESYITLTNFKKGSKRDASAYPIFKNERYYNTFIRHFKATAKAQRLNSLMDPNFTPGSDEHEQKLFEEQQDFLYSVLISSLKTEFNEALVKDHEGDAQLILELLHEHHTGNSQYSRAEINRITKYLTNIKLDDTWRGTNESFPIHYNDQLPLLDSLVDSGEKLPDNTRVTFLESVVESVPDLQRVKITDNVFLAQLGSTGPISYRSYFDLLKDAAFHLDQSTKRGNKIRCTNVHFSGPNDEDEHQTLSSDDNQVIQQENVCSESPEPLSYSLFQSRFQGSSTSNTQKIFLPKPIWEKLSKDQQQMIIDHNRILPKSGSATTPRSTVYSEASEYYITLTNFMKGIKRDASAYPIFKNERYYNTFIRHFKATAKAQRLNSLMDPNFTPGSDEHEQELFEEQQDFLYSVLISSLKTEFSEALVKDHEGDAQLILELLREYHTGNSQYSRAEINRITKYLTNLKLDDTWRGTNESFPIHYNDQLSLLDSLVDSGEKLLTTQESPFLSL